MHFLGVCGSNRGQRTVSVVELVPNIKIYALERHCTQWKRAGIGLRAEQYHLDIVGVSSTKRRGSDTVELNEGSKLFYSGANVTVYADAGVGILVSHRLTHCVTD